MKFEIEYEYDQSYSNPYIAKMMVDGSFKMCRVSDISFEDAKVKLVEDIKIKYIRPIPTLPEPEEVELNEDDEILANQEHNWEADNDR